MKLTNNLKSVVTRLGLALFSFWLLAVQITNPADNLFVDLGAGENTFEGLAKFIITSILSIVGVLAVIFLVIGGAKYIMSGGDSEAAESGKKTVTNAILGLVIVVLSYVIVVVVLNALYGDVGQNTPEIQEQGGEVPRLEESNREINLEESNSTVPRLEDRESFPIQPDPVDYDDLPGECVPPFC